MSVRKPHTLEIRAAHPYLKKSWVPPPGENSVTIASVFNPRLMKGGGYHLLKDYFLARYNA